MEARALARGRHGGALGRVADRARDHAARDRSRYAHLGPLSNCGADAWRGPRGMGTASESRDDRWARLVRAGARAGGSLRQLRALCDRAQPRVADSCAGGDATFSASPDARWDRGVSRTVHAYPLGRVRAADRGAAAVLQSATAGARASQ